MDISIFSIKGEDTGRKVVLDEGVFLVEPNDHAIYLDVKQYLANQRQGTHKAKERAEVARSTRKVKRQKGTGTARMGSLKSPLLRGGGRMFGPKPRDYSFKLNKKLKVLARKSALSYKVKSNEITVIENFSFETPRTRQYLELLKNLSADGLKTLLVLPETDKNVYLSSRNLQKAKVMRASELNTYEVLNSDKLILCEGSIEKIQQLLS
jgi:large subunit ribosomal protein L4